MTLDWDGNLEVSGEVEDGNGEKISDKADKVTNATSGHLAGLDSNGNLTDSGVSPTEDVTVEGNPVEFESPFEQDAKRVVVSVKPIQAGSGTPSPDNIRPISGTNEVEIEVSGKNLCEKTFRGFINAYLDGHKDIYIDNDSESAVFYAYAGQTYCLSPSITAEKNVIGLVSTDNIVSGMPVLDTDSAVNNVWTATWTGWTVWYAVPRVSADFEATCQIELGSTPTAYEPYKGSTTTIPLPSTLYDADVDVTNGSGENRYGYIASYNGETLPGAWISDRDVYTGSNSPTIGAEVCYELATPTTISFDPADVELLEGTNVVSTNGEKVAVTYGRSLWQDIDDLKTDTEGKLDKSDVATIEGDTASKAYSVNEFMLRADGLYKVTAPIASGASITASNTTKTTIGAVLTALLNA